MSHIIGKRAMRKKHHIIFPQSIEEHFRKVHQGLNGPRSHSELGAQQAVWEWGLRNDELILHA